MIFTSSNFGLVTGEWDSLEFEIEKYLYGKGRYGYFKCIKSRSVILTLSTWNLLEHVDNIP